MKEKLDQANESERLNHGPPKPRRNRNADEERMSWQMRALNQSDSRAKFSAGISFMTSDVEEVIAYNFLYEFYNLDWMSSETLMIIKEPWLRYTSQSKILSLRVDSPSDIIFVDLADKEFLNKIAAKKWFKEISKDAEVLRNKAYDCFKNGNFEKALFLYDRGIRCNPEFPVLYLNKALTCLRTGAFYIAYEAAKLGMGKGAEQKYGKYDFKAMLLESKKERAQLDVADYTGPIKIANIPGKGRGILATKNIQKGALLCVSKAFSTGYSKDYDTELFNACVASQMQNELKSMKNLQNNPQRSKEIYDLYSGDLTTRNEEIPAGVIDAALIQRICTINRFGSYKKEDKDEIYSSSLFILPSYFNHACLANAYRTNFGDVMAVHAIDDIKKDDEIYLPYVDPFLSYPKRMEELSRWKFTCHCKLCELDSKDKNCLKRNKMWEEFKEYQKTATPKDIIAKGKQVLKKIRESYANRNELKIVLAQILIALSSAYYQLSNLSKCTQCLEEVLTLMDNPLKYDLRVSDLYMNLSICYASENKWKEGNQMIDKAMELRFCKDMDNFKHFKLLYP
uniref:SET domain-containing protein n=1 Tax=Panagrolaimus davidi TaxID=227884 RepID=A0A914Q6Q3_9BILA